MDFNFNNLDFKRVIMHTIIPKQKNQDHPAEAVYQEQLFELSEAVKETLRSRLVDAVGMRGRSFQLSIKDTFEDSFFELSTGMKLCSDDEFIIRSKAIADRLARSQDHANLQGGFLLVVQGVDPDTNTDWYITIKAEPHQALVTRVINERTTLEVLDKIFLSPTQKLFKIGMIEEVNLQLHEVNQKFKCYIFDYQFSTTATPAKYFYDDFLGFSISGNMQIQSKRYYTMTEDFIKDNLILDSDAKQDALDALRLQFRDNSVNIEPEIFSQTYFESEEVQAKYTEEVASELPANFLKDKSLINTRLATKKLDFPEKIKVTGPDDTFDKRVKIIKNQETLDNLRVNTEEFTILIIDGRPFKK